MISPLPPVHALHCCRPRARTTRAWPLVLLAGTLALALGGCGQKGPLYLPNARKAPVAPTPGAATPAGVAPQATPSPQKPQQQKSDDSPAA